MNYLQKECRKPLTHILDAKNSASTYYPVVSKGYSHISWHAITNCLAGSDSLYYFGPCILYLGSILNLLQCLKCAFVCTHTMLYCPLLVRFVRKVQTLDPQCTAIPWKPRSYTRKRLHGRHMVEASHIEKLHSPLLQVEPTSNTTEVSSG